VKGAFGVDAKTFKKSIRYMEKALGPRLRRNTYDWKVLSAQDMYNRTIQQLGWRSRSSGPYVASRRSRPSRTSIRHTSLR